MSNPKRPPTIKTIRATLTKLLREVATVYQEAGVAELTKTSEHGTISVTWKDGRMVLEEKTIGQ